MVTGAVRSRFFENLPTQHLIGGSSYAPARTEIENTMNRVVIGNGPLSAEKYAEQVVANALRKSPQKRQWVGGMATLIWLASTFLWATAWVCHQLFTK